MPVEEELRLAELLCARLCHDLSGPIAGASAGAELLADEDPPDADTAALVAESVAVATRLLRVLRAALGSGSQPFAVAELEALARSLFPESGATRLALRVETGESGCDRVAGKALLNLLMVSRDALPRGGCVTATITPGHVDGPGRVEIVSEGARIIADEAIAALAAVSTAELGPRGAQAFYTGRLVASSGQTLTVAQNAGRLTMTVE